MNVTSEEDSTEEPTDDQGRRTCLVKPIRDNGLVPFSCAALNPVQEVIPACH